MKPRPPNCLKLEQTMVCEEDNNPYIFCLDLMIFFFFANCPIEVLTPYLDMYFQTSRTLCTQVTISPKYFHNFFKFIVGGQPYFVKNEIFEVSR